MASYTAKVNSIIVYGESSAMPVPSISFSSPNIVVDGHSSIVVIPTKILFSSPNVEIISSHKQVIFNDLGILALGPGTSITPGVWTVAAKGGAAILVSPARLVFNDSNIQMYGHKTVVSNDSAILNISGSNEIFAGSGDIIYPLPTGMNLYAFANIVLGTRITPAPPKLIFSTQDIILVGDVLTQPFMSMSLPGFEMGGESGGLIEAEIPEISLTGELFSEKIASLNGSMPKLSLEATSGGYIDLNMPVIEQLDIQASTPIVAELDAKIQSPDLYISATHGGNNSVSIVFPSLQASCDVITGETANIIGSLLTPNFTATGYTGEVADVTGNLPMLKSRIFGSKSDPGTMNLEIESLKLSMESGSVDEGILRHVRGKIR
jgi:hypothetical protein